MSEEKPETKLRLSESLIQSKLEARVRCVGPAAHKWIQSAWTGQAERIFRRREAGKEPCGSLQAGGRSCLHVSEAGGKPQKGRGGRRRVRARRQLAGGGAPGLPRPPWNAWSCTLGWQEGRGMVGRNERV